MFQLNKIKLDKINLSKIKLDKNLILVVVTVSVIIATGVLIFSNGNSSTKIIAEKSVDYLNKNILQQGQTATLESFSEESGVIKISIKIGGNSYSSYTTKDGKLFFPEALNLDSKPANSTDQNNQPIAQETKQTCDSLAKADKPLLEAYVVSKCPFGLQMQRAMADAVTNIPSLSQLVKVRYIGDISGGTITAMHGEAEAQENLRQICIREEQDNKYWDYVSCHIKAGDVNGCLSAAAIDSNKLNGCITDNKRGLAYAKEDFSLNSKYSITGSPTLILNGQPVSEFDFGGRSSEAIKTLLACGHSAKPDFSSTNLNTDQAATSFSLAYTSPTSGSGKSGSNGANCAPTQ